MIERLLIAALLIAVGIGGYLLLQHRFVRHANGVTAPRGRPTILYFRSESCPPCVAQWRFLQQVRQEFGDSIDIETIDAESDPERAGEYGIFTVPTTLIVGPDGNVHYTNFGLVSVRKLSAQVGQLVVLDD